MERYRGSEYGTEENGSGAFGERPAFPGVLQQRLFSRLMAQERYADLDKAKHNPHYLNYLLETEEEDLPF